MRVFLLGKDEYTHSLKQSAVLWTTNKQDWVFLTSHLNICKSTKSRQQKSFFGFYKLCTQNISNWKALPQLKSAHITYECK